MIHLRSLVASVRCASSRLVRPPRGSSNLKPRGTLRRTDGAAVHTNRGSFPTTRSLALPFSLSVVAGLGACDRAPGEGLLAPGFGHRPQATALNASPAIASGAVILRFSTVSFILVFDAERQLLSAHMPSDVCGAGELNVVQVQRVSTPSEIGQVVAQVNGDERVAVYQAASPADAGLSAPIDFFGFANVVNVARLCSFLAGPTRIAEGTVQRISTLSAASFHARWTGTIQGVDGNAYHLVENYQLNSDPHDPTNPNTFVQQVASIKLAMLP